MHGRLYVSCPSLKRNHELINPHMKHASAELDRAAWHYRSLRSERYDYNMVDCVYYFTREQISDGK
eukprot:7857713-Prorocentrum_lima.AAC.1